MSPQHPCPNLIKDHIALQPITFPGTAHVQPSYAGDPTDDPSFWAQPVVPIMHSRQRGHLSRSGRSAADIPRSDRHRRSPLFSSPDGSSSALSQRPHPNGQATHKPHSTKQSTSYQVQRNSDLHPKSVLSGNYYRMPARWVPGPLREAFLIIKVGNAPTNGTTNEPTGCPDEPATFVQLMPQVLYQKTTKIRHASTSFSGLYIPRKQKK